MLAAGFCGCDWVAAPCVPAARGAGGVGAGRTSIGGGSVGARSAVGAAGFGFCAFGVAGWGRAAGCGSAASGSVCTAAGTAASVGERGLRRRRARIGVCRGCSRGRRRRATFERLQLLRLLLDRAQREPARERGDVDAALGRIDWSLQSDGDFRTGIRRRVRSAHPGQGQPSFERGVGQVDAPADGEIGALRAHRHVAQPRLSGIDCNRAFGKRDGQDAARERRIHSVSDSRGIDRKTLIHRPHHGLEGGGIKTHHAPVLELERAVAGERAHQRNGAQSAPFDLGIERQLAR